MRKIKSIQALIIENIFYFHLELFVFCCSPDYKNITFQILDFNISIFKYSDVNKENMYESNFLFWSFFFYYDSCVSDINIS